MMHKFATANPALFLLAGIVSAIIATSFGLFTASVLSVACVVLCIWFRNRHTAMFTAGFAVGAVLTLAQAPEELPASCFYTERNYRGVVERVNDRGKSVKLLVTVDDGTQTFRCHVITNQSAPLLLCGDSISFRSVLSPVATDPVYGIDLPASSTLPDRISAVALIPGEEISITGHNNSAIYRLRHTGNNLAKAIYASPLSPMSADLLTGACLGGDFTSPAVREQFRASGLAHLLCVSGFHVALVAAFTALLLYPLRLRLRLRTLRLCLIITAVWIYTFITGIQPSSVRAAVMISVFLTATALERSRSPYNSLFIAVSAVLIINPFWLYSVGFQLSVSAVAAIIVFADRLNPFTMKKPLLYKSANIFTVAAAAAIGTAPVLIWSYHRVQLLSLPFNALISVFFPVFMAAGMSVTILSAIGIPCGLLSRAVDISARLMTDACDAVAEIPFASIGGIYPDITDISLVIGAIILAGIALHSHTQAIRCLSAIAACLCVVCTGCTGKTAAEELIIHRSDIIVSRNYSMLIVPLSPSLTPCRSYEDYSAVHGIPPAHITVCDMQYFEAAGRSIAVPYGEEKPEADIVVVTRLYHGDISRIAASNPELVVLSSDITPENRLLYIADLLCLGTPYADAAIITIRKSCQ